MDGQWGKPFRSTFVDASAVTRYSLFFLSYAEHDNILIHTVVVIQPASNQGRYLQKEIFHVQSWVITSILVCFLQVKWGIIKFNTTQHHEVARKLAVMLMLADYLHSQHCRVINDFGRDVETLQLGEDYCRCHSHICQ